MSGQPSGEPAPPLIPGLVFAHKLGSGGYSDVYLYEQQMPLRKVAVKVLKVVGLTDALRQRFTAEANSMAALADHPHIVPVFAADVAADGRPYLVMSYYPRANLGEQAAREQFTVSAALRVGIQITSAVETAHRAGILHRDIKPANILSNQYNSPGLTDFGIAAQVAAAEDDDDDTGVSVPWSPPEVLYASSPASVRSDVYSLAATIWHLLVGRSPFEVPGGDNSSFALMRRVRDVPPPSTGRAEVPASLDLLLRHALAKDPARRPASAMDFARALQAIEQEQRLPRTDIVVLSDDEPAEHVRSTSPSGDVTRVRAPVRVHAQVSPGPAPVSAKSRPSAQVLAPEPAVEARTLRRGPAGLVDPLVTGPVAGSSQRFAGRAVDATVMRPEVRLADSAPEPEGDPGDAHGRGRYVVLGAVVGLIAVAAIVGVALGAKQGPAASPVVSAPDSAQAQNAGGQGDNLPPGPPVVTAKLSAAVARFSWTYSAQLASDTFRWQTSDGKQQGVAKAPLVELADQAGKRLCVQVKVVRADGSNAAVTWSDPGCAG